MTQTIAPESVVRRSVEALGCEVAGEVVLLNLARGRYYGFDSIASDVWRRIEGPTSMAALVADLARAYEGDPAEIATDAGDLLGQLQEHGLVDISAESR